MGAEAIENTVRTFHWLDYTIFGISLFVSLVVGMFSGAKDWADMKFEKRGALRAISSLKVQFLGGQDLKPLPVALSLLASFLSAPFLLGTPAEIYVYGTMYTAIILGFIIAVPVTAHLFVPVFHAQQMTSSYEFIEKRFNHWLRLFGSCLFSFMMILYMSVVVYTPASAFAQVTGLPTLASILGVGVICTVYTAFGGMRAVVWTDVVQMVIILIGVLALIIEGTVDVGGPANVWKRVTEGSRIQTDAWSLNPAVRHTWWSQMFGGFLVTLTIIATNQTMIQKYLSIKSTRDAQKSVYYSGILQVLYILLILALGLVMYAFYHGCDPIATERIQTKDQLVPVFVMDSLGSIHGLPGLFSASVFAASLSTVSAGVNSLAAVVMSDIVLPLYKRNKMKKMPDLQSARLSKILALLFGLLTVGLAFLAPVLGPTVLQIAMTVFGMVGGPLLGLFILAIFFPFVNDWGAFFGTVGSIVITSWITIGSIVYPTYNEPLSVETDKCPFNFTLMEKNETDISSGGFQVRDLFSLSYMWYALLSVVVSLLIALPASFLTGGVDSHHNKLDPVLFYPYHRKCRFCYNCCGCDACLHIEDEEEIVEAHAYGVERGRKRSSVDSVFGMYHEDPIMKRSSIAIQYGPTGSIMGGTIDKVPIHMIAHRPPDLGGIMEEEEEEDNGETHGVSNPSFQDSVTIHPAITLHPDSRHRRGSEDVQKAGSLGLAVRGESNELRRGSRDLRQGSMDLRHLSVDPKALEAFHMKVDGEGDTRM